MGGETRLGEVADIIMGQSPPGETYNQRGEGLPFFQGVADFNYRHPTPRVFCSAPSRIALPGDILLSVRAPIGRVNVANRKCAIGRGLSIIRPKRQEDGRYLEFALRMQETNWTTIEGSGCVFGNATRRDLEELVVPWRAKCRGEPMCSPPIGQAHRPAPTNWHLPQHILDLFPDRFVDSELGEIPEG
jgi:type I restriction enzyme S subunit